MVTMKGTTPVGELMWVKLTEESAGKELDKFGNAPKFSADLFLDFDEGEDLANDIDKFFRKNCTSGPASNMPYTDNGEGFVFKFKTQQTFQDGKPRVINVYDRDAELLAPGTNIGNGSTGRINFTMGVYDFRDNRGVTLFLDELQIQKLVKFKGTKRGFGAI